MLYSIKELSPRFNQLIKMDVNIFSLLRIIWSYELLFHENRLPIRWSQKFYSELIPNTAAYFKWQKLL